ncbi:hypothetical protein B0H14DRAFT_2821769 [Mycena olivaceomarginata]|nr:hypothetical protein B0H14DRAFT_2821769 [Mycena olivaceomarginata]
MRRRRVSSAPVWGLSALAHQVCYSSPRATSSCNCTHRPESSGPGVWARRRPTTVRDNVPQACNKEAGTYFVPRMSASEVVHSTANGWGYKQLAMLPSIDVPTTVDATCGHQTPNFAHSPESSQDFMPTMILHANGHVARPRVPSGCIGL